MDERQAVLLDTVSIQKYIFQSPKLKQNLGASYLIESVYEKLLQEAVKEIFPKIFEGKDDKFCEAYFKYWENTDHKPQKPFDIGYIGGGNTLLLFDNEDNAKNFIKVWTKKLLIYTPGIMPAIALENLILDSPGFSSSKDELFASLTMNKSEFIPQTELSRHGITAECKHSGLSQEAWNKYDEEYVSASIFAKIAASAEAKQQIHDEYSDILNDEYCFTDSLEQLGQISNEDSHIAIVHIDGNDIGNRFKAMETLASLRELSVTVDRATKSAFKQLLSHITDKQNFQKIIKYLGFDNSHNNDEKWSPIDEVRITDQTLQEARNDGVPKEIVSQLEGLTKIEEVLTKEEFIKNLQKLIGESNTAEYRTKILKIAQKKFILPIRSIILGGDDVTFVCDGKLGLYFAEIFIKAFEKQPVSDGDKITACGGVAIIKTKYPFYRGYQLAEELCKNAKLQRKKEDDPSYIDFHISTGGLAGTLEEIRNIYFPTSQGKLFYRPYKLIDDVNDDKSFKGLIQNAKVLEKTFPKNKINKLREILTLTPNEVEQFITEMKILNRHLPEISERTRLPEIVFEKEETPYYDMIEILKYYPLEIAGGN